MAAVVTETSVTPLTGSNALVTGTIALDNSYPTGGYAIDTVGSTEFTDLVVSGGAVSCRYDKSAKKLLCYVSNGASPALLNQAPNTTDLSSVTAANFIGIRPN